MKTVAIAGPFDTKGTEYLYAKELIESLELNAYTIHTGVSKSTFKPDISNEEVVKAAGRSMKVLAQEKNLELTTEVLSKGMENLIPKLYEEGKFNGII
ncbi:Tm-1-like ATP-binding domain-containing protein, partial [Terrisporobacter hibernicus]